MQVAILMQLAPINRISRCFAHSAHARRRILSAATARRRRYGRYASRGGLRDYQPESPAGRHAAALLIILVMASATPRCRARMVWPPAARSAAARIADIARFAHGLRSSITGHD